MTDTSPSPQSPSPRDDGLTPTQIGPYRIVERLGAGGMGEVYVAEQTDPVNRRVALKLIKLGMDSREIVARFQQERQALALMAHDGIAKIYDVGTTERGQPYFVMEYVKGLPLNEYCDDHNLDLKERIALIQQVCTAVTHAHQRGVLHRDLKPGNVLVADDGGRPLAKVIDFGLAKAMGQKLVDATLFTKVGQIVGTPEYMAPEQADPDHPPLDARVDVYALGVMLYETLVGNLPFASERLRHGGLAGLQRLLRDEEPTRPSDKVAHLGAASAKVSSARRTSPSALQRALRTDLDWVVLKAMEKDRNRRYDSPAALSADLQRHLDHEPVLAGPPSAWYRLQKLVRRRRGQFAALAVVGLSLLAGGGATWLQWRRAVESEEQARQQADENARLARRNAALVAAELQAKSDTQRTIDDFEKLAMALRLKAAAAKRDELWPPWPEKAAAMADWLAQDCAELLAQRPKIEQTLAEIRSRALPRTPEQAEQDRRAAPEWLDYARATARVLALRRQDALWKGAMPLQLPALPESLASADAAELYAFAWPRVAPESWHGDAQDRAMFGEEAVALVAMRLAVERARPSDDLEDLCTGLAWAEWANGQADAARAAAARADAAKTRSSLPYSATIRSLVDTAIARTDEFLQAAIDRESRLAAAVAARREWKFPRDDDGKAADRMHGVLAEVLAELDALAQTHKPDVERRLAWAQQVAAATAAHPKATVTWAAARAAIAKADDVVASSRYAGCKLTIPADGWLGLVPIGMNPATKLWEFYDLRSAWNGVQAAADVTIPNHEPDGTIKVYARTGIVFVLLPGGTLTLGSQANDPTAPFHDPSHERDEKLHEVRLAPFLLARHEMTRSQWQRLAGDTATNWTEGDAYNGDTKVIGRTHPVDAISWHVADQWLGRHGMALPTEAQWEHGCRGGTTTAFWTGQDPTSLHDAANLQGRSTVERDASPTGRPPLRDVFLAIAPVGSFRPNPFGLFDVHGNMNEWVRDQYGDYGRERAGDGARPDAQGGMGHRTCRGGSYSRSAAQARSAMRNIAPPMTIGSDIGVRAARQIPE